MLCKLTTCNKELKSYQRQMVNDSEQFLPHCCHGCQGNPHQTATIHFPEGLAQLNHGSTETRCVAHIDEETKERFNFV